MKKAVCFIMIAIMLSPFAGCQNNNDSSLALDETTAAQTFPSEKYINNEVLKQNDESVYSIILKFGDNSYSAKLYKNESTDEFMRKLPLTLNMSDLNSNEKYDYLDFTLPVNSENTEIKSGDIMLYGDNCFVVFYESFRTSYSYTRLGYIENTQDFVNALGDGNITITIDVKE